MLIYATSDELAAFTGAAAPANAQLLLRKASELVTAATRAAVYPTFDDGLPSTAAHAQAMRDATLTQAELWSLNGIVPGTHATVKRRIKSKSLGGASATYETDAAADAAFTRLAGARELDDSAVGILSQAGLISGFVHGDGGYREPTLISPLPGDVATFRH